MSDTEVPSNWAAGLAQGLQQSVAAHNAADEASAQQDQLEQQAAQQAQTLKLQQMKFDADRADAAAAQTYQNNQFEFQKQQAAQAVQDAAADRAQRQQKIDNAKLLATPGLMTKMAPAQLQAHAKLVAQFVAGGMSPVDAVHTAAIIVAQMGGMVSPYAEGHVSSMDDPDVQARLEQSERDYLATHPGADIHLAIADAMANEHLYQLAHSGHPAVTAQPPQMVPAQEQQPSTNAVPTGAGGTGANIYAAPPVGAGAIPPQAPAPQQAPQGQQQPPAVQAFTSPAAGLPGVQQAGAPVGPVAPPQVPVGPTVPGPSTPGNVFTQQNPTMPIPGGYGGPPPTETGMASAAAAYPAAAQQALPLIALKSDQIKQNTLTSASTAAKNKAITDAYPLIAAARVRGIDSTVQFHTWTEHYKTDQAKKLDAQKAIMQPIVEATARARLAVLQSKINGNGQINPEAQKTYNRYFGQLTQRQQSLSKSIQDQDKQITNVEGYMNMPPDKAQQLRVTNPNEYNVWQSFHQMVPSDTRDPKSPMVPKGEAALSMLRNTRSDYAAYLSDVGDQVDALQKQANTPVPGVNTALPGTSKQSHQLTPDEIIQQNLNKHTPAGKTPRSAANLPVGRNGMTAQQTANLRAASARNGGAQQPSGQQGTKTVKPAVPKTVIPVGPGATLTPSQ